MMRKILIPIAAYAGLAGAFLANSGAPARVRLLALAALTVSLLIPSIWSTTRRDAIDRLKVCIGCAVMGIVFWDATAHLVISKAEPFFVLRDAWVMYPACIVSAAAISFCVSYLACPPGRAGTAQDIT